nr:putative methyltransferase DDB_G0268948 [Parasteatoda tepidariorum]XP_015914814.2 putative methyltransferase DDB_G0268948 [Parasteatoda tepidariorum]
MSKKVAYVEDKLDYESDIYSIYRKDTPEEIMSKIMHFLKEKHEGSLDIAVDVGCGSGQSTIVLAPTFKTVFGIDGIESQIEEANNNRKSNNIVYKCGPAETLPFENNSVQLITTATSLHWFDMTLFFSEAKRILCNNGVLAVYGYSRIKPSMSTPALDQKVNQLYDWFYDVLDPYTKPQVKILIHKYNKVEFPFEEVVRVPDVRCMIKGSLSDIVGYVKTYSMLNICREQDPGREVDILSEFEKRLYKIGEEDNITPNEVTNLYIDYVLILCRKVVAQTVQ